MTVLKRWLIEWILKKPWLVTICPENFRIQMTLGRLFQFAGQNKTAYDAYCKAISAKTDAAAAYRSASRLAKEHPLRREWMSFLLEMKEKAKADNSIPLLYLLQEGTSITGDERMSLLFNAVGNSPNNASLIEKLVQEHIIQKRVEDLIKHEVLQHISILSSEQCRRLLNYALLASGEDAYTLLRDIFSRVNLSVPEMADINMQTIEDIIQLNLEEDGSGISVEKLKEFLRIHYFTNNYSDDELFRLAGKYKQWEPFCLEIAVEKLRFTGSVKLLIRTVEHILSLEDHEIIKGINLSLLGELLQKNNRYSLAASLYKKMLELKPNNIDPISWLSSCYRAMGQLSKALTYAKKEVQTEGNTGKTRKVQILESERNLLRTVERKRKGKGVKNIQNTGNGAPVLHVLNNSFPYSSNGYAVRSKYIVDHQAKLGLNPVVVTRLGFPGIGEKAEYNVEDVDDVPYYRLQRDIYSFSRQPVQQYLDKYEGKLLKVIRKVQPCLIHAASNFYNGYPALRCAQKLGIPFVYEVRGFWEMSKGSFIKGYERSEKFQVHHSMECHVMEQADHIVTISESLKQYITEQGLDPNKITVVPNAVDTRFFTPQDTDEQLVEKYQLEGKTVIGFIGSVTAYEGLDTLLHAIKKLDHKDIKVLIVGSGESLEGLKALTTQLNVEDSVIFVGRVPFTEVKKYYSVIDIFPFPRIQSNVCELVTPLKPYEAMAMERTVMVSKLNALKEMVIDGETGLYFNPGDVGDLADKLEFLVREHDERRRLAVNGRRWVEKNRDWQNVSRRYGMIYDRFTIS